MTSGTSSAARRSGNGTISWTTSVISSRSLNENTTLEIRGIAMPGGYSAITTMWPSWAAGSDQPARRSVFVIGHLPLILASTASRPW